MALEKKDVRLTISVEAHAVLTAIADLNDKEVGEQGSLLLERTLLGEAHAARLLAERAARFGKPRQVPDSHGNLRQVAEFPGKAKPGARN